MLYKVVLTIEPIDEILKCHDHSNESYQANFPMELFNYVVQGGFKIF